MPRRPPVKGESRQLTSEFTLGGEQAEADPLLELAFYESPDYQTIRSPLDPRCFIIGRTGSGKSALFQHLEVDRESRVIRVAPEDLSLPFITDLTVIRYLDSLNVHLDLFFIALWKHVLLVEILRHRYRIHSPDVKQNFLQELKERVRRDPGKSAAIDYLDSFGDRFWCETDERVREIVNVFEDRIKKEGGLSLAGGPAAASASAGGESQTRSEVRSELTDRFQHVVNETQLARFNKMIGVLDEEVLTDSSKLTYLVIDDLDRDWVEDRLSKDLIRCLFRSVLDLKRVRNLKVLVALRTNIFEQLDFGSSGGQEEKFRSLVLRVAWTGSSIERMLDARARIAREMTGLPPVEAISDLLPRKHSSKGKPLDWILARTLMRPRDAIAFLNEAFRTGIGKDRLTWRDLENSVASYSGNRLLALRDEWKSNYPGIERAFEVFRQAPARIAPDRLRTLMDDVALTIADPHFRGTAWVSQLASPIWSSNDDDAWAENYQPLIALFFDIGFLGIDLGDGQGLTFRTQDQLVVEATSNLRRAVAFAVHPTFQPALDIGTASTGNSA